MEQLKRLIREIHRRSLWQVLAIYVGASWVVFEIVQTLTEGLGLPEWFPALAFVLLLAGLPIVLATAFVQEGISGDGRGRGERSDPEPAAADPEPGEPARSERADSGSGVQRFLTWRNALTGGVLAFAAWGAIAAGWLLFAGPPGAEPPDATDGIRPDPAVAVLPFSVRGEGLEVWREGMVDLLSTGLDDVAGLRAIDSRTLLARWHEHLGDERVPDRAAALRVARATGARYALLGSAVSVGPEVRLVADVYQVPNGQLLGHPQVQGSPDSVLSLVDRFAVESLLLMLQEGERDLPQVNLASVTTGAIPALRAWLEGEAHFRRAEYDAAIAAYNRAVEIDSSFALAHHRLATAYGWAEGLGRASEARDRALRWMERLPSAERTVVRAAHARQQGSLEGVEPLRELVRRHPDYAEGWQELGETYYHIDGRIPVSLEEAAAALRRARELDPNLALYHQHPIHIAFRWGPDSARVRRLIDEYERLAPDTRFADRTALAFDLAFGDEEHRRRAVAALDTVSLRILQFVPNFLLHPRHAEVYEAAVLARERRTFDGASRFQRFLLFQMATFGTGRLQGGLGYLDVPGLPRWYPACFIVRARALGLPVAEDRPEAPPDPTPSGEGFERWNEWCRGWIAAERGRWADHHRAIERLREETGRTARDAPDYAAFTRTLADWLEAFGLARQGKHEQALRLLESIPPERRSDEIRWWLARLYTETGRWRDAIPYLRSFTWDPYAHADYRLGRAYEQVDEPAKARMAYARFVSAWHAADPELRPLVESAHRALERLTAEGED